MERRPVPPRTWNKSATLYAGMWKEKIAKQVTTNPDTRICAVDLNLDTHLAVCTIQTAEGTILATKFNIGSGLKTERKSLHKLLALVQDYQVAEVVLTSSDRLTRFGLSYLQTLFSGYGVILTILHPDQEQTPEQELTEDLLTIITSFAARLYGRGSRKQRALVACAREVLTDPEQ